MTPSAARGLFVTGTDTGVGKTLVCCALLGRLRARGIDAGAMKPIETGVGPRGPLDAIALREAAGGADPLDDVCPQRFALAAAPTVAAQHEQRSVDLAAIGDAYRRHGQRHRLLVVEGAGGLLAPAASGLSMAELARELALPLLVVARAALGTVNHTLLTLEAAAARQLDVVGVVISHPNGPLPAADAANLGALRQQLGPLCLGEIPPLLAGQAPARDALDLERLLSRLGWGDEPV